MRNMHRAVLRAALSRPPEGIHGAGARESAFSSPKCVVNTVLMLSDKRARGFPWPFLFFPSEEWIIPGSWCFTHNCFLN